MVSAHRQMNAHVIRDGKLMQSEPNALQNAIIRV